MNNVNYSVPLEQGAPFTIRPADPAGGAELTIVVPNHVRWSFNLFQATVVTGASAATRRMNIKISDPTGILYQLQWNGTQTASLTITYRGMPQSGIGVTIIGTNLFGPFFDPIVLLPNWVITVDMDALQIGDQISDVMLQGQRWVERNV